MKQEQSNTKEKTMNAKHRINDRIARKLDWKHASLLVLAAILALGFAVPPARAAKLALGYAMPPPRVEELAPAVIRVPVKLHHVLGKAYRVSCELVDKSGAKAMRGSFLAADTGNNKIPSSGNINTTVKIALSVLYKYAKPGVSIRGWRCLLWVDNKNKIPHTSGTTYRTSVSGEFGKSYYQTPLNIVNFVN